ncbi:hypothetical protein KO353_05185 [Elioraea tepida]|uniref:Uncharacterized protein n=1 Tax=Elioraea tepida TaxID=2843330 RepID=A0A975U381_9PROT|nr:hypothetical protein [Elioraea tepida]QXM25606.1 hypothetical protein KO353_05185 [Elioraea tepida]
MRHALLATATIAALGLAGTGTAIAQACVNAREQQAFHLRALQTHLMVGALSCGMHDRYNAFVTRWQSDLAGAHRNLTGYFNRTQGGQRALNAYITALANAHSQEGIRLGANFCGRVGPLFEQVALLRSSNDLVAASASAGLPLAFDLRPCEVRAAEQTPARSQQAQQPRR